MYALASLVSKFFSHPHTENPRNQQSPEVIPEELKEPALSEDEEDRGLSDVNVPPPAVEEEPAPIVSPHARWAWARGSPIQNIVDVQTISIHNSSQTFTTIRTGSIAGRSITYINQFWPLTKDLSNLFKQLAIMKLLQQLQGDILPVVIGVYASDFGFNVAMELPHDTLWMLADPDMSPALKQRCVRAFEKLHAYGILHGQPDLRHVLVGGDGRITLIDFRQCRTVVARPGTCLTVAEPAELSTELRIIKYKLNYDDARTKEVEKIRRADQLAVWVRAEEVRQEALKRGIDVGPSDKPDIPTDDITEPAPSMAEFGSRWFGSTRNVEAEETDVVVAGKTTAQVKIARAAMTAVEPDQGPIRNTTSRKRSAIESAPSVHSPKRPRTMSPGSPSLGSSADTPIIIDDCDSPETVGIATGSSRKRKLSESDAGALPKRPRNTTFLDAAPAKIAVAQRAPIPYEIHSTYSLDVASDLPAATSSTESEVPAAPSTDDPPFKVRDFASEPYDGARGYYVPHPPTEGRMWHNRALHIRWKNYYDVVRLTPTTNQHTYVRDDARLTHATPGGKHISRAGRKASFALGEFKRAWDPTRRPKYSRIPSMDLSKPPKAYSTGMKDDIPNAFARDFTYDRLGCYQSNETIQLTAPEKQRDSPRRQTRSSSSSPIPVRMRRGILRSSATPKLVSYAKDKWASDASFHPEDQGDGPPMIEVDKSVGYPILNGTPVVTVRSRRKAEAEQRISYEMAYWPA